MSELIENQPETKPAEMFKVGVVGDNKLAMSTYAGFDTPNTERLRVDGVADIQSLIEWGPNLVVFCEDIPIKKNDTLNDGDFIAAISNVIRQNNCGICIRNTLNMETTERLVMTLTMPVFQAKIIYFPVMTTPIDTGDYIIADYSAIGGDKKALEGFMPIMQHLSHFSAADLSTGSVFEVVYAKMAISGFKALRQKYFDQLHDAIMDIKNANPTIVRRMIEKSPDLNTKSVMVPSFISGSDVVGDVRLFSAATDKLPLLDAIVGE
jgi:hypothetical protein